MNKDLTVGKPSQVLWQFCLPMFGSIIFQQLYNIADSLVAGKFIGENALAAVGNSYEITLIFIAFAFGCNIGCSVIVSRYFGAKEYREMKTSVYTSLIGSAVLCAVLMGIGLLGCDALLMPMVTASATAEAVTYDAETDTVNGNVFRACFTDPFQGVKMADYAYEKLGYTKAAVIFLKGKDYNEGLAENFAKEFEAKGGTVVDQESYSEGDVDFKTQLTSILGKNPEMVFCPNYYQEVGQILAQAESVGLNVPFLGGDGWDGLEGYATADQLKDSYFCACYAKGSSTAFEDAYKAEYGEAYPNGFAPLGYDAAMTVVYGIKAAEEQGLEAGSDEYKQAVIDAIAGGTIEGITGTFTFDEHHNPVKSTAILTYVDGKPELKEMF